MCCTSSSKYIFLLESLDMAETSSHLFVHELSPQGLYLSCQVQVSKRRALKPPKKEKQKLLDTPVSVWCISYRSLARPTNSIIFVQAPY